MPQFNTESDFPTIESWLNENLAQIEENEIISPHDGSLADSPHDLNKRGVIFWFMRSDGYKELSKIIEIKPNEQKYQMKINGENYDLVYFNSALEGEEIQTCYSKLDFHINQKHNHDLICKGTLSTLRAGLGALLAQYLSHQDTEISVNDFMKKYMKVLWLEVENRNSFTIADKIKFINEIRPLFNVKYNPNAKIINNSSKKYKIRRALVYVDTRDFLNCPKEIITDDNKHKPNNLTPSFNHQSLGVIRNRYNNIKITEFFVLNGQRIDKVIRGIKSIGCGKVSIKISLDGRLICVFETDGVSSSNIDNKANSQNAYSYFGNSCYSSGAPDFEIRKEGEVRGISRWKLINQYLEFMKPNEKDAEIIIEVTSH